MNSNRSSTVPGGFISKQSNGTDGASSAEPIKCTGQSGVSFSVPIKHYHPLRCQACFLVIFISQSVQSPLRNINSPFGFHGVVNLTSDSNKRFVYDVGAYDSDDDKADQNVGTLIGKDGEIVRNLQLTLRPVEIIGNLASIEKAEKLISEVIAQVGVIIGREDYQEHADKVESTDSGCPFYL
uniref:K Homology domain-containing protein n=1 Tax=Brassica oleracea TaxID=3712 RepID=A0A3P6DHT2_BRAOL|nr:unnamed protein product [Brassica oleracea]